MMRSLMICTHHQISFQVIKSRHMRWVGHVAHVRAREEVHIGFWLGYLREIDSVSLGIWFWTF
jgi:hypothetical protein